jgi:hypothetical protein
MAKGLYEKRKEARRLRSEGLSLNEITAKTGAAKSSVSLWVRDIELTGEQKAVLQEKNPAYSGWHSTENRAKASQSIRHTWALRRMAYQEDGKRMARKKDANFIAGCMLYWAEGSKNRNTLRFTNSDENMMRFFAGFLKNHFKVGDEDIGVTVRFYSSSGLSVDDVEEYWEGILGVPRRCFKKAEIDHDKRATSGQKIKYKYGICAVQVNDVSVVQKIYGAIQEYVGFVDEKFLG